MYLKSLILPMQFAQRLRSLQSNVFADMDTAKATARASGQSIIDLSLGSSDLPTAPHITQAITAALQDSSTHGYLLFNGTKDFRVAVAQWYEAKYGVSIDPHTEVLPLIGSQEGTAHLPLAILNPGDYALLLDPGYPSHAGGVYLAGGKIHPMPISIANNFLPVFTDIPSAVLAAAKMMVLSYPHNPTAAVAPLSFFKEAVDFCQQHGLVLVHDFPYGDMVFDDQKMPSIFQADRAKTCSIEFFTMSKSYNMGGFRIGYAVGNRELIGALRQVKAAVDFNQYLGILHGAVAALTGDQANVYQTAAIFQERRDVFVQALAAIGWPVPRPSATMYIWAKLPEQWSKDSIEFCKSLVAETGVAASPGVGFGAAGEGYVRFALVHPPEVLRVAVDRIGKFIESRIKDESGSPFGE
jgi:aspartate/methionine/tyrosine aminotransferase